MNSDKCLYRDKVYLLIYGTNLKIVNYNNPELLMYRKAACNVMLKLSIKC